MLHNTIDNIWNAEIASSRDNEYVVKNVGWNQDIAVGGSVAFGFSGNQAFCGFPERYEMIQSSAPVQETDYGIEYIVDGDWGSGFYGSINVTNTADSNLEEWILEFDFDREITEIWNGVIEAHEGNHYVVRNAEYNSIVVPDEVVSIGIKGSGGSSEDAPYNYSLYGYGEVGQGDVSEGDVPGGSTDGEDVTSGDVTSGDATDGDVTNGDVTAGDVGTMQNYTRDWSEMRDTDGDGLPDEYENHIGTDIHETDTDGDELTDGYEELYSCTDPLDQYTVDENIMDSELDPDEDGLTMLEEAGLETDSLNPDSDEDGLIDGEEVDIYGTKPMEWDTDQDTINDGDEVKVGLDPLNPETYGYPDAEYQYEAEIAEDSEILEKINADNTDYQMSLAIKGQGSVISELIVRESAYEEILASETVVGCTPEILHRGTGTVEEVTVKFKIHDANIYDTYGADSLQGVKRYHIFLYYEEENMPVPLETVIDEETNTISATVDRVGTFCVVDMEKWLDHIGFEIKVSETPQLMSLAMEKGNAEEGTSSETSDWEQQVIRPEPGVEGILIQDKFDIAFCLNKGTFPYGCSIGNTMRERVLDLIEYFYSISDDVRVTIIDADGNIVGITECVEGIEVAAELVDMALAKPKDYQYFDKQVKTMAKNVEWREDTLKLAVFWGTLSLSERLGQEWDELTNREIRCALICSDYCGYHSSLAQKVRNAGGFATTCDSSIAAISGEMYRTNMKFGYNIITSTSMKKIVLDQEITNYSSVDSDGDNLPDWKEVRTNRVKMKGDISGKYILPTYYEYMKKYVGEYEWMLNWAARYYDLENLDGKTVEEFLDEIYVLPVKSDPTLVDSDGDGISDYDESTWDGVDERYRNVGPLHKDTIETLFPELANEGTDKIWDPAYITVKDNDVVMNMRVVFLDNANEKALKYLKTDGLYWRNQKACDNIVSRVGEDVTFKELFVDAINERWGGAYEGSKYDFYEGMKVNFSVKMIEENLLYRKRVVKVNFYPGVCGRSNATTVEWNKSRTKIISLYTGCCDIASHNFQGGATCSEYLNSRYDAAVLSGTCAHEAGHVMGLKDLYADAPVNGGYEPVSNKEISYTDDNFGLPESKGIMRGNGIATPNDIEMILLAFISNWEQYYVPQGETQRMSLAIKSEVEFHRPSIPNAVYEWNEFEKRMKLK